MLLGGAVAAIVTYINRYSLLDMLKVILTSLLIFLLLGYIAKIIFDKYVPIPEEENPEETSEDGSVIEKVLEEGEEYEDNAENVFDENQFGDE